VRDPHGRLVSNKRANQPYLAYARYREQMAAKEAAKAERAKRREEKLARGEELTKDDFDPPDESDENAVWALFKVFVVVLSFVALTGKFVLGSYTWGYEGKWVQLRTYWPTPEKTFTDIELRKFDGTDPSLPIYVALDGDVFDVSASARIYGPGGGYAHFSGADHARAFATGCFKLHDTHDLRGLSEAELASIEHWKDFFRKSEKYFYVGKVIHPPIDPSSPIPPPCDEQGNAIETGGAHHKPKPGTAGGRKASEEL